MTMEKAVDQATILQGDRAKLQDLLRRRLTECGWRDEVKLLCRNIIKEKSGNVNVDQLVREVTPEARKRIPAAVKKELLMEIKSTLSAQEGIEL